MASPQYYIPTPNSKKLELYWKQTQLTSKQME